MNNAQRLLRVARALRDLPWRIDVMPPQQDVLGFANRWYEDVLSHPSLRELGDGVHINDLREYTAHHFDTWLKCDDLQYAVFGYLRDDSARVDSVLSRIQALSQMA